MVKLSKDEKNNLIQMFKSGIKTEIIIEKYNIPISTFYYLTKNYRNNEILENSYKLDDKLLINNYKLILQKFNIEDEVNYNNYKNIKLDELREILIIELLDNKFYNQNITDIILSNKNKNLMNTIDKEIINYNDNSIFKIIIVLLESIL
jgi:hypothetical protein